MKDLFKDANINEIWELIRYDHCFHKRLFSWVNSIQEPDTPAKKQKRYDLTENNLNSIIMYSIPEDDMNEAVLPLVWFPY